MSTYLIAIVGFIYAAIAVEQYAKGHWEMGVVWMGYSIAQYGLWRLNG